MRGLSFNIKKSASFATLNKDTIIKENLTSSMNITNKFYKYEIPLYVFDSDSPVIYNVSA